MRRLPTKPDEKQKLIILAVKDFFSEDPRTVQREIIDISCWLMNRKKEIKLTEEQLETADLIRTNLADSCYRATLVQNAPVASFDPVPPLITKDMVAKT
jgi:hypothetical protein